MRFWPKFSAFAYYRDSQIIILYSWQILLELCVSDKDII